MRLLAKIGIGILIFTIFLLAIPALKTPTTTTPEPEVPDGSNKITPTPQPIKETPVNEITVGNFTIAVYSPTYTKTFYEDFGAPYFENWYATYTARNGFHFALVKVEATNIGKIEDSPPFYSSALVTTEGLIYKESSVTETSTHTLYTTPTPLFEEFSTYQDILPRETRSGYLYFEIPINTTPDHLTAKSWEKSPLVKDHRITINL